MPYLMRSMPIDIYSRKFSYPTWRQVHSHSKYHILISHAKLDATMSWNPLTCTTTRRSPPTTKHLLPPLDVSLSLVSLNRLNPLKKGKRLLINMLSNANTIDQDASFHIANTNTLALLVMPVRTLYLSATTNVQDSTVANSSTTRNQHQYQLHRLHLPHQHQLHR